MCLEAARTWRAGVGPSTDPGLLLLEHARGGGKERAAASYRAIETEEDVLHVPTSELPTFDGALGARDAEVLLQTLTAPLLRIPLLLGFFAEPHRFGALGRPCIQRVLDGALFEPAAWRAPPLRAPPARAAPTDALSGVSEVTSGGDTADDDDDDDDDDDEHDDPNEAVGVNAEDDALLDAGGVDDDDEYGDGDRDGAAPLPSLLFQIPAPSRADGGRDGRRSVAAAERARAIATPCGLLFNELRCAPKPTLRAVCKLADHAFELDAGKFSGPSSGAILYACRLVSRVEVHRRTITHMTGDRVSHGRTGFGAFVRASASRLLSPEPHTTNHQIVR